MKDNEIELDGVVTGVFPNARFKVRLDASQKEIFAHLCGKVKLNYIKILQGDRVRVKMNSYDLTKGRIFFRYKGENPS